jgi:O-6-methylguanine DNA methyltransferase
VKSLVCARIEADLAAVAAGEADAATVRRVNAHVAECGDCRALLESYRRIEMGTAALREGASDEAHVRAARERLDAGLVDLRKRIVRYAIFPSPLGDVMVARSELGVVFVEYVSGRRGHFTELFAKEGLEPVEDDRELAAVGKDLDAYLAGGSRRLPWPIDLRLAKGAFQRSVLEATAAVPYGAVVSYKRIAQDIGRPSAVRAVAQALRHNPVALAIPCHRVIGTEGDLTGYAGGKTSLKEKLLTLEGVRVHHAHKEYRVERRDVYLLAPGDSEYCLPTCPSQVSLPLGTATLFGSRERAESAGYRPCTTCRPDLHPLSTSETSS